MAVWDLEERADRDFRVIRAFQFMEAEQLAGEIREKAEKQRAKK